MDAIFTRLLIQYYSGPYAYLLFQNQPRKGQIQGTLHT